MPEHTYPKWATPSAYFLEYMFQAVGFVNLTYRGADLLEKLPDTVGKLMAATLPSESDIAASEDALTDIKWAAELAKPRKRIAFHCCIATLCWVLGVRWKGWLKTSQFPGWNMILPSSKTPGSPRSRFLILNSSG